MIQRKTNFLSVKVEMVKAQEGKEKVEIVKMRGGQGLGK